MDVTLRPITRENWRECINLTVHESQQNFVAPNVYSLAQARVYPEFIPLAIYAGERMIGFLVYDFEPADNTPWIVRFMIDHKHQGKSYGRVALQELVMLIEAQSERSEIRLSIVPGNTIAERLYQSIGFAYTGEEDDGELIMQLKLD